MNISRLEFFVVGSQLRVRNDRVKFVLAVRAEA